MEADLAIPVQPDAIIQSLHGLLEEEEQQVRRANFADLELQGQEKSRLIDLLMVTKSVDAVALQGLRDHARRNAALLAAALRGVRAARRRFDLLRRVQTSLNIYDNRGRRLDVQIDSASVERRA